MSLVIRIVVAILVGLIVTGLLNYFNVLNEHLNALIGLLAAIVTFFSYDGWTGARRV